jgi:signal transduction histidine kinase
LIDNILDFAKIESGRTLYHFERADLAETIAETLKAAEPGLQQSGFSLHYDGPATGVLARIDRDAIAEAVWNLTDNAVRYSGSAKDILVRLEQVNGTIQVSVTDQGIGLNPEETERIFEKFYRVSNGLVHNVRGSGLGLTIAKHIVEAHGGKITVESQPDRGSTFTIHIPSINGGSGAEGTDRRR